MGKGQCCSSKIYENRYESQKAEGHSVGKAQRLEKHSVTIESQGAINWKSTALAMGKDFSRVLGLEVPLGTRADINSLNF